MLSLLRLSLPHSVFLRNQIVTPNFCFLSHHFPVIMPKGVRRPSSSFTDRNSDETSQETTVASDSDTSSTQSKELKDSKAAIDPTPLAFKFEDSTDEGELGKLMGADGEKLLNLVDNIRKIDSLRNEEIDIPQIVVIGETSSGKSSVLQALSRLPFPVAVGVCTRFVTETTIQRCGPSEKPGYKIEVRMDGLDASQDPPFPTKSFESDSWAEVYHNLREDLTDAFEKMSPDQLPTSNLSRRAENGYTKASFKMKPSPQTPKLQRHRLQVVVRKSNQAHFSIVDIPGLISSGLAADVQTSEELARQYIRNDEAIVLAVAPANNVLENQKWLNLVTEEHALSRTIGVLTKADLVQKTTHEFIFDLLRNRPGSQYHLKLGWFAVRNRDPQEVKDGETFEERDRTEAEFFKTGEWQKATLKFPAFDSISPSILGVQHLKHALQDNLYKRVRENFPRLRSKMRSLETEYANKLRSMGDPRERPRDQRVYLSGIQAAYEAEVERSLHGGYRYLNDTNHPSRLRFHIKDFNKDFASSFEKNSLKYHWQENAEDDTAEGGGILQWIDTTWLMHRGSEPQSDRPRSLKKELVKQQTESWEARARSYIQIVEDAIKACNDDLFLFACKDNSLRHKIRKKLAEQEKSAFESAQAELQNILLDREYIDSWNPDLDTLKCQFQRRRFERHVQIQREQEKKSSASASSIELSQDQSLITERFFLNNKVYEEHDWLRAYWKVSCSRFIDNVIIQVVERHLLGRKGPLRLFSRNWILELEDDELEYLGGENEDTREKRKDLKARLEGLRNALELADEVIRET